MMPFSGRKQEDIKRLLYEARSVAKLEHLNIVQVYDVGFQRWFFFIVMQLLQGDVLEHLLEDRGAIPQADALEIAHQVLRGLAEAHGKGIIHRDVKPSNIVLGEDGQARLTDFGLAQDVEDAQDKVPGQIAGTPFYVAPEVWLGHRADERSDLYSLGVCLYQMTTGKKPFAGRTVAEVMHRHLKSVPPSPKEIVPVLTDGFSAMVRKAMAKAPGRRYATAAEFLDDLERVKRGDDPMAMSDFGNFIKCGFCEALNPEREKKCSVCGEKLRMFAGPIELAMFKDEFKCPSCTAFLKKGTRECPRCGMQFCVRCRLRKAELKGYCQLCLPYAEKKK
jgi:serine/threonine protein kinase